MVGNAGLLVSEVIYVKKGHDREFLILDAAMNDLLRPALYEAYHDIVPVKKSSSNQENAIYDVVGPVCETGTLLLNPAMKKCSRAILWLFVLLEHTGLQWPVSIILDLWCQKF